MNISYQAHKILRILDATPVVWNDGRDIVKLTLEKSEYEEWLKILVALDNIEFGEKPEPPKTYNHTRVV